jgi:hypothetical protein
MRGKILGRDLLGAFRVPASGLSSERLILGPPPNEKAPHVRASENLHPARDTQVMKHVVPGQSIHLRTGRSGRGLVGAVEVGRGMVEVCIIKTED